MHIEYVFNRIWSRRSLDRIEQELIRQRQAWVDLRNHTDRGLADLRAHTDRGFAELRAGIEASMEALRAEMIRSTHWQVGTTITLAIAVPGMLAKLIGVV